MRRVVQLETAYDPIWEAAYAQFETPEQEIRKFTRRLIKMGVTQWSRDAKIVELFCGRGNGLHALSRLGFTQLEGVDLSATLLAQYTGPAHLYQCDCRQLHFDDSSRDIIIVQGGLHHLPTLPSDLERTLLEIRRVLRDNGIVVVVEPWLTLFLICVHQVCRNNIARRLFSKIDALAVMIAHEQQTYDQWLHQPHAILRLFDKYFRTERCSISWGKLMFTGSKRTSGSSALKGRILGS